MLNVITIDGPSGVGKGTIAQWLSKELDWALLDSGSLYRLTALAAMRQTISLDDAPRLSELAKNLNVHFVSDASGLKVFLDNEEVNAAIRTESTGLAASKVATIGSVREALLDRQRQFAADQSLVCDGRDMGTVVFPQAILKLFITASVEERANRRYKQLIEQGVSANIVEITESLSARDKQDRERKHAPLCAADDAITIDTSNLSINEVKSLVKGLLEQKGLSN